MQKSCEERLEICQISSQLFFIYMPVCLQKESASSEDPEYPVPEKQDVSSLQSVRQTGDIGSLTYVSIPAIWYLKNGSAAFVLTGIRIFLMIRQLGTDMDGFLPLCGVA